MFDWYIKYNLNIKESNVITVIIVFYLLTLKIG